MTKEGTLDEVLVEGKARVEAAADAPGACEGLADADGEAVAIDTAVPELDALAPSKGDTYVLGVAEGGIGDGETEPVSVAVALTEDLSVADSETAA